MLTRRAASPLMTRSVARTARDPRLVPGAVAFVGAFAPITKSLALKFATAFYKHLLEDGLTIGKALWQTKADFKAADEQAARACGWGCRILNG